MKATSPELLVTANAAAAQELHGVAVLEMPLFDPEALPHTSRSSRLGNSTAAIMSEAMRQRANVLWRTLYPRTAPPTATATATAAAAAAPLSESGTSAGATAAAPATSSVGDAVRQGILTVVGDTSGEEARTTGGPSGAGGALSHKRARDGDEILSVNPEQLKARTALVVSRASAEEAASQQYTPPARWKLAKVLVGHQGWVWAAAVEPGNKWFATGGFDAIIKVWDLETCALKMNLTGHKEAVRSIALSKVSPYMFSGSDDHSVKCWDLERNEVVREFFGHKSSVHCVAAHPSLDVVISGSRDKTVRVFDLRSRAVVHTMVGHTDSVMSLVVQPEEPQVISGGSDGFIYLWDLASGKPIQRLTRHKKPVRGLAFTASGNALVSCGADEVRVWSLPSGEFVANASTCVTTDTGAPDADELSYRWSCCAMSPHNVLAVGSQDGELAVYDWNRPQPRRVAGKHYAPYQWTKTKSLPGTIQGEGGINAITFDVSGTRLITAESDKSVKVWRTRE
ncbi:WD domain, G-beta repeat [Novymonas esmeraldas]|uniref:WD domain, G-beta repeat n=1 Tax=Novymonas esmeraldas TaxID=1808958 RepID=A0AAW0F359_9TRYP